MTNKMEKYDLNDFCPPSNHEMKYPARAITFMLNDSRSIKRSSQKLKMLYTYAAARF